MAAVRINRLKKFFFEHFSIPPDLYIYALSLLCRSDRTGRCSGKICMDALGWIYFLFLLP